MIRFLAAFTAFLLLAPAVIADTNTIAASIFEKHDPELQERLGVSISECKLTRTITRPNTCGGNPVSQIVEKRVYLKEVAEMKAERFREPDPFMMTFELELEAPNRWQLLQDRLLLGEEEARRRFMQRSERTLDAFAPGSGTYFSRCDGTFGPPSKSQAVTLFLDDRPAHWQDLLEWARSCGVRQFVDDYNDE